MIGLSADYGMSLCTARRLTEDGRQDYGPKHQDLIFVRTGTRTYLPHVSLFDTPRRRYDGKFLGCGDQAWVITQEEQDMYLALEEERQSAEEARYRQEEIERLIQRKEEAEAQQDLPAAAEAQRRMREWNNIHNKSGEGYVPHVYSQEEYRGICARLADLQGA